MLNQNDKLERFSAQINRTAEKTVQKIQKQTEKISNTQLETFRAEAQEELEERMTYAEGRLQREANGAVARQGAKRKQQAALHREEIVADVFDRAKAQLSAFANTQDYQALLQSCITSLLQAIGNKDVRLFVRAEDVEKAKVFAGAINSAAEVLVDNENRIGLARVETADGSVCMSDTFQSRLDAARVEFLSGCGLSILPKEGD